MLQSSDRARAYVEHRGLDAQTVSDIKIGYAPTGWENLRNHLTGKGYTEAQLLEASLLVESEQGRAPYDRFRDRLIVPIRDDRGRVVGFGGRVMPDADPSTAGAKYVNTAQSPVFDKSGLLYALDRA
jgi:DNA primase